MKWLVIFCLLAVHQINAMPKKEEEEEEAGDKLVERSPKLNAEELQEEGERKLFRKREAELYADEVEKKQHKLNSRKRRNAGGQGGGGGGVGGLKGDDSSEDDLDLDVDVKINAPQPHFKADIDIDVNINAENDEDKATKSQGCKEGDTWMEECNVCQCTNGVPSCTKKACLPTEPPVCQEGDNWMEGCNACICSNGVISCFPMERGTADCSGYPPPPECDKSDPLLNNPCCYCFEGHIQCDDPCLLSQTTETTLENLGNSTDVMDNGML